MTDNEPLRLSKRLSELGLCSRREADEYIERGWVLVDGQVVNQLGFKVTRNQTVALMKLAEKKQNERVTVLLNKPIGYVSGQAEHGYKPAYVLVTPENRYINDTSKLELKHEHLRNLVPAGRLDIDSTGLLILTQDGRIAKQLIGEESDIEKEYLVRIVGALSAESLRLLNHGLSLDGEQLKPGIVSWQNDDQLRFILKQGKKRQIRRMCEMVGLQVTGLRRVRIGRVRLSDLPTGQWRYLLPNEQF